MAPRKTKKKGRKGVLDAGRTEADVPVVENAPNTEPESHTQQPLQKSQIVTEGAAPLSQNGDDLPLLSIETTSVSALNLGDVDDVVDAPAASAAPPSRTSSPGLGLAHTIFTREKSIESRKEVEKSIDAYKSPFGSPAPVTARQPSTSRQLASLSPMIELPTKPSRNTRTCQSSIVQVQPHSSMHDPLYSGIFGSLQTSMNPADSSYFNDGSQLPSGSPSETTQASSPQQVAQAGFQQSLPSSNRPSNGEEHVAATPTSNTAVNGYGNAASTPGFIPSNGLASSQHSTAQHSTITAQSQNRFVPVVPIKATRSSRALSSAPLQGRGSREPKTNSGGFVPSVMTPTAGGGDCFATSLASVVDNTIRQISVEAEHRIPSGAPEAGLQAGGTVEMIDGPSKPLAAIEPAATPKRGRGRPKKSKTSVSGNGKDNSEKQSADSRTMEHSNRALPPTGSDAFARSMQSQKHSNGFVPVTSETAIVNTQSAPASVSRSAQIPELTPSALQNRESSTSDLISTADRLREEPSGTAETSANQAKSKRKYTKQVVATSTRSTRALAKQNMPAGSENNTFKPTLPVDMTQENSTINHEADAAESTAPTRATAASKQVLQFDSETVTAQSTSPARATRASKRKAIRQPSDNDEAELMVEEPKKKRKYTRKSAVAAPVEDEVVPSEQQPVFEGDGIDATMVDENRIQNKSSTLVDGNQGQSSELHHPISEAEDIESNAANQNIIQKQTLLTSSKTSAQPTEVQSAVEKDERIPISAAVHRGQVPDQHIADETMSQPVQTGELSTPIALPSANLGQVSDQGPRIEEQGEENVPDVGVEEAVLLNDVVLPIVRDTEEVANELPGVPEDDSEPVNETRPKRKRTAITEEIDPEEPPAKRAALPADQSDLGNAAEEPKPPKRYYQRKKHLAIAEAAAQSATDAEAFGIPCSLQGEQGHLVLTANMTRLEFFALTQHPPELIPRYSLLISDLARRPTTSARKSNPMCIRFKGKNDPRASDYAFAVDQSDQGYTAMHEMRSRIVAASLQSETQPIPEVGINARKHQCEKCGKTFKNPNGLEYHLEKSQEICNDNFDPTKVTPRVHKGGRKKKIVLESRPDSELDIDAEGEEDFDLNLGSDVATNIGQELNDKELSVTRPVRSTRIAKVKTPQKKTTPLPRNDHNNSSDSEDSIYAWAEATANGKTATGGSYRDPTSEANIIDSTPKPKSTRESRVYKPEFPNSTRRYKNLQDEGPFLATVAEELANQASTEVAQTGLTMPLEEPQLTRAVCEKRIEDLVIANNGLFPGDKSMWFAFVAVWWKDFKLSKLLPESKRCCYLLDELVETGRLRKLDFAFRDKKSREITRTVFVAPGYNELDESFDALKESMKAAHPAFYVPEAFRPPQHILDPLEKLVIRPPANRKPKLAVPEIEIEISPEPEIMSDLSDDDEEFQMDASASVDEEDYLLDMNLVDSIEEDTPEADSPAMSKNEKIAASIRKWHEKRRALGLKAKPRRIVNQPNRVGGPPVKRGLTKEEREKLYLEEASSPCWGAAAPAFMPNPVTGAWDSRPVRLKCIPTAVSSKPRGVGHGFAEPITYLQSENGAWNHRAYGHGVKPIYSRPSKLVAGNPSQAAYLSRLQSGFRPVVYPTKNRVYGPAPLTKSNATPVRRPYGPRSANKPSPISQDIELHNPSFTPIDQDSGSDFETIQRRNVYKDLVPDSATRPKKRGPNKSTKTQTPAPGIDEIDMSNLIEPKKMAIGSTVNPGLTTLPSTFNASMMNAPFNVANPVYQTSFSFPQTVAIDSDFNDGSWVSNKKGPRRRTYHKIRFDEQTAFTLETLPYEELEDCSDVDEVKEQPPLKRLRFSVPNSIDSDFEPEQGKQKVRGKKLHPTRIQTALAVDFDGLTEDPEAFALYNGVQMLPVKDGDQVRKRLRIGNRMTRSEEKRFIVTVMVIRVVAGGIDQFIDWVLVANLFPEFSMNYLSKSWAAISKKKQDLIDELVVDFQEAFLVGYRDGKIKSINFDDLLGYDWARLVRWTMNNVNTSLTRTAIQLPADRDALNEDYFATEVNNENGEAQKMYFGLMCPIYRRLDAVAARQMTIPTKSIKAPGDDEVSELMKAKSFARSSALTPIETWDFHAAKNKLTQLSDTILEEAINSLKDERVIIKRNKARSTTGRIYEASDAFAAPLRKPIRSEIYMQAYRYKELLDASFRSGTTFVSVDYFADDGSYMCVTSMMASGRLRVTGRNIPIAPMGLGDDAHPYDTKRIPKAKMRWDIDMSPSPTYLYNEDIETLENITEFDPPVSRSGAVPAWNGIHDSVIPSLWKRILCAVLSTVALRTGISKRMLRLTFKPTLEEWEISLFMRWCEEVGFVERLDEDENVDGWLVGEWFWLCLGRLVERMERMEEEQRKAHEEVEMGKGKGREVD